MLHAFVGMHCARGMKKVFNASLAPITLSRMKEQNKMNGPMLAKEYSKERAKVRFPMMIQPKLDGMRMLYDSRTQKARSRSGKSGKTGAQETILAELAKADWDGYTLDGELYKHGRSFQDVMRAVKSGGLEYYVYDLVSVSPFQQRYELLKKLYEQAPASVRSVVKLVPTAWCHSHEEVIGKQQQFVKEGYEGAILRDPHAPYAHARTSYLLKLKSFEDAEFKVVGYKPHAAGGVVWECETEDGKRFWAAPTAELKKEVGSTPASYVGRWLTVKFFGRSEDGVPRHPNAKAFRLAEDLPSPKKRVRSSDAGHVAQSTKSLDLKNRKASAKRSPKRSPARSPARAQKRSPARSPKRPRK